MQGEFQFVRIETFTAKNVTRILGEASRVPEYCPHVPKPKEPTWMLGSAERVNNLTTALMAVPSTYVQKNGRKATRKRRNDFRCLVGGVCSWPLETEKYWTLARQDHEAWRRERDRLMRWLQDTLAWLKRVFGNRLAAALMHLDESHPHVHFFLVGDARLLHPGLRAEYIDGVRIASGRERTTRYRAAMREFLDSYYAEVAAPLGLSRRSADQPKPRIRDRNLALRILELERRLDERDDVEIRNELEQIKRDAPKYQRQQMRF